MVINAIPATGDFLIYLIIGLIVLVVLVAILALVARKRSKGGGGPDMPGGSSIDEPTPVAPASTSVVDPAVKAAVERHAAAARSRAEDAVDDNAVIGRHGRID